MTLSLEPVVDADFETMLALRVEALRESLERLGRFDPAVARARLKSQFRPEWMQHIVVGGERIGFFTVEPREGELRLHHLYIKPGRQGQGHGAWVLDSLKVRGLPITLAALKQSRANDFYLRHGFRIVEEQDFDIEYRWQPAEGSTA